MSGTTPATWRDAPTASWLALVGATTAAGLAARSALTTRDLGDAASGVLAFVVPYLVVALALRGRTVWSRGLGVGIAVVMTWLTSFGAVEVVTSLREGDPVRPAALTFGVLTVVGLVVAGLGARDLALTAHRSRYWTRTPAAARLAFLAVAGWTLAFVADTYLTANPPLARMLLAPGLLALSLGAAFMLRARIPAAQAGGVLLAAGAALGTAVYWAAFYPYLTMGGGLPVAGDLGYATRLPWPALLAAGIGLDLAIAGFGLRRLLARPAAGD
jgi:hypothetical protein